MGKRQARTVRQEVNGVGTVHAGDQQVEHVRYAYTRETMQGTASTLDGGPLPWMEGKSRITSIRLVAPSTLPTSDDLILELEDGHRLKLFEVRGGSGLYVADHASFVT